MACGAIHHHLVKTAKRTKTAIVVESAEAREVHHLCLLFGYGADAINPYLAYEVLVQAKAEGIIKHTHHRRGPDNRITLDSDEEVIDAYRQGLVKGVLKVMGKMGISTLQSYKGAQIFEALGLSKEVIELCFSGTASRIQGTNFQVLEEEIKQRHSLGWPDDENLPINGLPNPGEFHWRSEGEKRVGTQKNRLVLTVCSKTER